MRSVICLTGYSSLTRETTPEAPRRNLESGPEVETMMESVCWFGQLAIFIVGLPAKRWYDSQWVGPSYVS